jgi:hypothetical protein
MNLFQSFALPIFHTNTKTALATCDYCQHAQVIKDPAARKAGIQMHGNWYCSSRCFIAATELELSRLMRSRSHRSNSTPRMPLGLSLVSRGVLSEDQFREIARKQKKSGCEFSELLIQEGILSEEQLTAARAAQWDCPVFDVPEFPAPANISIPQALIDAYEAVPLHYANGSKTLLVGFERAVEYALLYAVETVVQCRTQPCFVTPTGYRMRREQRRRLQEIGDMASPLEVVIETARTSGEIARSLCKMSVEFEADEAIMAKCKEYIWVRLKSSGKEIDLLFVTA